MRAAARLPQLLRRTPCTRPSYRSLSSPCLGPLLSASCARLLDSSARREATRATGPKHRAKSTMTSRVEVAACVRSHLTPTLLHEVRNFWFEHLASVDSLVVPSRDDTKRWFMGGEDLDRICVEKFSPALQGLRNCGAQTGADILDAVQPADAYDWLSLVILLDQMPRNCYRGDAAAVVFRFFDPMARDVALAALDAGVPHDLPQMRWQFAYRHWFFLPLMHSEHMATHERALREYLRMRSDMYALVDDTPADSGGGDEYHAKAARVARANADDAKKHVDSYLGFEQKHLDIIRRFGRYPHRNKALGRETTAAEAEYLDQGGETFGQR